jgi:hypothetical protein
MRSPTRSHAILRRIWEGVFHSTKTAPYGMYLPNAYPGRGDHLASDVESAVAQSVAAATLTARVSLASAPAIDGTTRERPASLHVVASTPSLSPKTQFQKWLDLSQARYVEAIDLSVDSEIGMKD